MHPCFSLVMDFTLFLLLPVFLGLRNAMRARQKGVSMALWGILTVVFFIVGLFLGIFISFAAVFRNSLDMAKLEKDVNYNQQIAYEFSQAMISNPVHFLAIMMCGLGGYLLVRAILGQKPDKEQIKMQ